MRDRIIAGVRMRDWVLWGILLGVFLAFGILVSFIGGPEFGERETKLEKAQKWAQEQKEDRIFQEQINLLESSPCATALEFWKAPFGIGWYIGVPGGGSIPADRFFSPGTLAEIEKSAVRGQITVTEFMQDMGQCP